MRAQPRAHREPHLFAHCAVVAVEQDAGTAPRVRRLVGHRDFPSQMSTASGAAAGTGRVRDGRRCAARVAPLAPPVFAGIVAQPCHLGQPPNVVFSWHCPNKRQIVRAEWRDLADSVDPISTKHPFGWLEPGVCRP
ncbi:hypothetical protein GCM10009809_38770 [Isoptericola hypogeus]|uniref:Uncharacterized protein n=1 Tax=Isoptericola hypogeus TaxID=300179 RepID=A0ABN2JV66_9MICO